MDTHQFEISSKVLMKLKPLARTNNYSVLSAILFDYATIFISVYATIQISYWFYPISIILIGSTQRAFVNLLHEATHGMLAKNKVWNFIAGTVLSSYLVFHMFVPYRNSHIGMHHRYLGDAEKDPDYNFHLLCELYDGKDSHFKFVAKNLILALVGFRTIDYVGYVIRDRIFFRKKDIVIRMPISVNLEKIIFLAQWALVFSVLTYFQIWLWFLLLWIVPFFTTAVAIGWCSELAEHYPLPQSENKRLFMTRNRHGWLIERFLFGRHFDNYHLVHHIYPTIPFYNLRKAHKVLLEDEAYRRWDSMWGGIFTRNRRGQETLISYIKKYRAASVSGDGDGLPTFAERLMAERGMVERDALA